MFMKPDSFHRTARHHPRSLARTAGVFYLVLAGGSGFAFSVNSRIFEADDAQAVAAEIRTSTALVRAAFLSELLAMVFFVSTAMVLYKLLGHVQQLVAAVMVICVAISAATRWPSCSSTCSTMAGFSSPRRSSA
jgi:uncharacterized membrane protein